MRFDSSVSPSAENVVHGCRRLLQEHGKEIVDQISGQFDIHHSASPVEVLQRKDAVCQKLGVCDAPLERSVARETDCDLCSVVAEDVEFELARMRNTSDTHVRGMLDRICELVPMRHSKPSRVESFCMDYVDANEELVVGTIRLRNRLIRSGFTPNETLQKKLCTDVAKVCPAAAAKSEL